MFGMGPSELMIVGIIAVLLFGRKLPEVAKSLGSSYREFRKGLNELQSQVNVRDLYSTSSSSSSSPKSSYPNPSPRPTVTSTTTRRRRLRSSSHLLANRKQPVPTTPPSGDIDKNIAER